MELPVCTCRMTGQEWTEKIRFFKFSNPLSLSKVVQAEGIFRTVTVATDFGKGNVVMVVERSGVYLSQ